MIKKGTLYSEVSKSKNGSLHEQSKTIATGDEEETSLRYKKLCYENEKLRRDLWELNESINKKIEKVKFPAVKKSVSLDLGSKPPSKALKKQLENATKQTQMYKRQIEMLRVKDEAPENYEKLENMENQIKLKDKQIVNIQKELKAMQNINHLQENQIQTELKNQQIKQRLVQYSQEEKKLKEKLKKIGKKNRQQEQIYKKQQAYAIVLEKRARQFFSNKKVDDEFINEKQEVMKPQRQITQAEMKKIKEKLRRQRKRNDKILQRIQISKKYTEKSKRQRNMVAQQYREQDTMSKILLQKIQASNRLIKEEEKRHRRVLTSQVIEQKNSLHIPSTNDQSLSRMQFKSHGNKEQVEACQRKVFYGFAKQNDTTFQFQQDNLLGFRASFNQCSEICGLTYIFEDEEGEKEEKLVGQRTNIEVEWIIDEDDEIRKISGYFDEKDCLCGLVVQAESEKKGQIGKKKGNQFGFSLKQNEYFSCCFGSMREVDSSYRITEIGFLIQKDD